MSLYSKFSTQKINVRGFILKDNKVLVVNQYTSTADRKAVWTLPGGKYTFPFRCNYLLRRKLKNKIQQKTGITVQVDKALCVNNKKSLVVFKCIPKKEEINVDFNNKKNKDVIAVEFLDIKDDRIKSLWKAIQNSLKNF